MRTVSVLATAVLATAALACAALVPGAAAPAQAVVTGVVSAVTVGPGPYVVDGVSYADAAISVTASDTRGAIGDCDLPTWGAGRANRVRVTFEHESGDLSQTVDVDLLARTTDAGSEKWTGSWRIGSTRDGYWMVSRIWWCVGTSSYSVDPRYAGISAPLLVVGTHQPTVILTRIPAVAAYGAKQWMRATYRWPSGRPVRSYAVAYGSGDSCGTTSEGSSLLTTDTHGQVTVRLRGTAFSPVLQCLYLAYPGGLPSPSAVTLIRSVLTRYESFSHFTVRFSATRVRVGHTLLISGSVSPVRLPVRLERLVGRTWTWIGYTFTSAGGRFTMRYLPSTVGTQRLRLVAVDPDGRLAPSTSTPVTITVTRT